MSTPNELHLAIPDVESQLQLLFDAGEKLFPEAGEWPYDRARELLLAACKACAKLPPQLFASCPEGFRAHGLLVAALEAERADGRCNLSTPKFLRGPYRVTKSLTPDFERKVLAPAPSDTADERIVCYVPAVTGTVVGYRFVLNEQCEVRDANAQLLALAPEMRIELETHAIWLASLADLIEIRESVENRMLAASIRRRVAEVRNLLAKGGVL